MRAFIVTFNLVGFCTQVLCLYLPEPNPTAVEETQHAVCKIITEEIEATANASITRQLKGVCGSDQMNNRFDQLERNIMKEIEIIKNIIISKNHEDNSIAKKSLQYFSTLKPMVITEDIPNDNKNTKKIARHLSMLSRDLEILKFNSTIQKTNDGKIYVYYWKIYEVKEILKNSYTYVLKSPQFYVSGFSTQINLMPHHLGANYVGIQLQPNKYFLLKHRISVLSKTDAKSDLTSQLLGDQKNFATMYRISHEKIENEEYINDDSLIIKVIIYLNYF